DLWMDVLAHYPPEQLATDGQRPLRRWLHVGLRSSGFRCVAVYRLAHAARTWLGIFGRPVAAALFWFARHWYGCTLAPKSQLGGGLILPHPQGIVIGPEVIVGRRAWIFQNATIGGAPGKVGMPRIGDDARVYAGAVITGPVTL